MVRLPSSKAEEVLTFIHQRLVRLKEKLEAISPLEKGTFIFTSNITTMYTNIDVDHCLTAMDAWLKAHTNELPDKLLVELIMKALKLVMKSNVFLFGDTWWLQLLGVARGTPCACIIAICFINDIIRIWKTIGDVTASDRAFESLKQDINKFGILRWI
eukprot:15347619-Ditylum_brightwellii.AAC.1